MRLTLASMPWQAVYRPSLPVGLLHSLVERDCPGIEITEYHGSLTWLDVLSTKLPLGPLLEEYRKVGESGVFEGLGELIFASALYDDPDWQGAALVRICDDNDFDTDMVRIMRTLADDFVSLATDEVLGTNPDVVGLTSTFMQNVASLALARRIKQRRPGVRIVLGGANCDGVMGHALHRNHRFVDYVVRGEAEQVFPELLRRIEAGTPVDDIAGVCWWDGGRSVANPLAGHAVPPGLIPLPDYDTWHEAFSSSPLPEYVRPELVIEGSRGCWWGEKHQCTFCGLNGSLMAFRSKRAERFLSEIATLGRRHQILDFITSDNILDVAYYRELLPLMAQRDHDLRVHFEIKSNLRPGQMAALAAAGMVTVQAGIESLDGHALRLMDKGVDGTTNVQLLRDAEDNHVTVVWNYLYGFPGETDEDYLGVIDQLPALIHLQPPNQSARIVMERFNPYFERPELGFARREPAAFYRHVYNLPPDELADLAYFFDCDEAGIGTDLAARLDLHLNTWTSGYVGSALTQSASGGDMVIEDSRHGWEHRRHVLTGWRAAGYGLLARPRTADGLTAKLTTAGHQVAGELIADWLVQLRTAGLIFTDGSRSVAIATTVVPLKVA